MEYNFQKNHDSHYTEIYLNQIITESFSTTEIKNIKKAVQMAKEAHRNQLRGDGSLYIVHPLRVALLMIQYERSIIPEMFIAAIFHDAIEDTELSVEQLKQNFNSKIAEYTLGVTRYRPIGETPAQRKEGKLKKWEQIMQSDREIRLIKSYDYLDNMICWKFISFDMPAFKKIPRWLMEAKDMYLPLAKITSEKAFKLMNEEFNYYQNNGFKTGNWYSDDLLKRLQKEDSFYIDTSFQRQKLGPKEISISGGSYYRFMDFFYIPKNIYELKLEEVIKLCELRLKYISKVVDYDLNTNIVKCMVAYIKNHLPSNFSHNIDILDFGCGSGLSSKLITQYMDEISLDGIDISEKAVELATQIQCNAKHISIGEPIPFSDKSFDFVIAVFVMHFNIGNFYLTEIHRTLKRGGRFVFNTYNRDLISYQNILHQAGFQNVREIESDLPSNHTIIICTR